MCGFDIQLLFQGKYAIGTTKPDPMTCSEKKCVRPPGRVESTWTSNQMCKGCGCCEYDSTLICDGQNITTLERKVLQCCEGKLITSDAQPPTG